MTALKGWQHAPRPVTNQPGEVWARVNGFPGYHVSSAGRVRRRGRLLKLYKADRRGHLGVTLYASGGIRMRTYIHRLVAEAFVPNPDGLPLVRHLDGDPALNAFDQITWGTSRENSADAQRHGTVPTAQHGSRAKYNSGCRCSLCADSNRIYRHARRLEAAA
jgi:hypothetical protein